MKRFFSIIAVLFAGLTLMAKTSEPLKVLAIGNSFSMDAVEQNLHEIAAAADVRMIIGNMYIGGCSIDRHVSNLESDSPSYSYRKISLEGVMTTTENYTLSKAIADEKWDYVSVQQVSQDSGVSSSFARLGDLINWIRQNAPQARIIFHQTWAYAKDSDHKGFANYGNDQQRMYSAIMSTVREQSKVHGIRIVVPSGTAIQNARKSPALNDNLTRDGYHLDLRIGRYIAAAAWFEALTGKSVIGNRFCPENVSAEELSAAQKAAHLASRHPYKTSH